LAFTSCTRRTPRSACEPPADALAGFLDCVRTSLPYAWSVIGGLITELGAGDAHFRTAESVISLMLLIGFLNTLPGFMDTLWGFIRYPLGVYRHI
jgi:hypothetical protein